MVAQLKSQFHNSGGERVRLGSEIARGGEGRILNVPDHPELVAKIYHRPIDQAKAMKLSLMVSLKTDRLLSLSAWPVDTLHDFVGGPVSGFLMPRIIDHKDIHILYGVKSRNAEYPEARWPFLIQSAANIARAFNVIHEHGHVIGDVNHGSIVVSRRATVRLVDCDSFQITAQGHQFLCEVGISTHLPPELQGRDLHGIVRTVDHDSFGLAVIIFQLLFMGRHPFSGTSLGTADISLEKAIREHRFAYGPGAESRLMRQPPATLGLCAVSPQIAALFERAFLTDADRPTPHDWIGPLTALAGALRKCTQDSAHYFLDSLGTCPWCEIESHSGIILFKNAVVDTANDFFDLMKTWVEILGVPPPSVGNLSVQTGIKPAGPTPESLRITRHRHLWSLLPIVCLFGSALLLLLFNFGAGISVVLLTILLWKVFNLISKVTLDARQELNKLKNVAEQKLIAAETWWKDKSVGETFSLAVSDLAAKKNQYENLSKLRRQKIEELQKTVRERQFHEFLSAQKVEDADLPQIGPVHVLGLRSCGIETAEDLTEGSIKNIPTLKPEQVDSLMIWRNSLTLQFNDKPKPNLGPAGLGLIEAEISNARIILQRELQNGPAYLRQLSRRGQSIVETGRPEVNIALAATLQAQEDVRNCTSRRWIAAAIVVYLIGLLLFYTLASTRPVPVIQIGYGGEIGRLPAYNPPPPRPLNNRELPANKAAANLYNQALELGAAGNYSLAKSALTHAIAINPHLTGAQLLLGQILYEQKKYKAASEAFKRATLDDPNDAETFAGLGRSLRALNKSKDSINAFQNAIVLDSKNASHRYNLGLSYKANGDNESAVEAFKEAIKLQPRDADSHYELGMAYVAIGDLKEATSQSMELNSLNQIMAKMLSARIREAERKQPRVVPSLPQGVLE